MRPVLGGHGRRGTKFSSRAPSTSDSSSLGDLVGLLITSYIIRRCGQIVP